MAKITLTVEGEPSEIRQALKDLFCCTTVEDASTTVRRSDTASDVEVQDGIEPDSMMTARELEYMWEHIRPEAALILQEIATRPEGYPFADLQRKLNLDGRTIGGRLSSIGIALNSAMIDHQKHPIIREQKGGQLLYRMRPEIARTLRSFDFPVYPWNASHNDLSLLRSMLEREDLDRELRTSYERSLGTLEQAIESRSS